MNIAENFSSYNYTSIVYQSALSIQLLFEYIYGAPLSASWEHGRRAAKEVQSEASENKYLHIFELQHVPVRLERCLEQRRALRRWTTAQLETRAVRERARLATRLGLVRVSSAALPGLSRIPRLLRGCAFIEIRICLANLTFIWNSSSIKFLIFFKKIWL